MTDTILRPEATTSNAFDLDAAIADALAAHDATRERAERDAMEKERAEAEAHQKAFITKALTVLPPAFLHAVTIDASRGTGTGEFVRNGHRYRIWETSHNKGGGHMGWGVAQVVSDGTHQTEFFNDTTFFVGLLAYIGRIERTQERARAARAAVMTAHGNR